MDSLLVLALALSVAACGGDSDDPQSGEVGQMQGFESAPTLGFQ